MPDDVKPAAPLAATIRTVQARFTSEAALQHAVGLLTRQGFDRAALALPVPHIDPANATPEGGASNPNTDDDQRQLRTLGASSAAAAGAMLGAAATVATGGAAVLAVAAAAATGRRPVVPHSPRPKRPMPAITAAARWRRRQAI